MPVPPNRAANHLAALTPRRRRAALFLAVSLAVTGLGAAVGAGAADPPASITIVADSDPDHAQDFSFSGSFGAFTLDDDTDAALANSMTFGDLEAGTYTVTQDATPATWALSNMQCSDGGAVNLATRTATITLDAGSTVTCWFTNTDLTDAQITVELDAEPEGQTDFSFDGSFGAFTLDDDTDPALPDRRTFDHLAPGTYTVRQLLNLADWNLDDIDCDHGTINRATGTATVTLAAGQNVTCTFENQQDELPPGSITVVTHAVPDPGPASAPGQDFEYDGTFGTFVLDDDDDSLWTNSITFTDLQPADYSFTQLGVPNWSLSDLSCDGSAAVDVANALVIVHLASATDVVCTFTNTESVHGSVTIVQDTSPASAQDFAFAGTFGDFTLDDDADPSAPSAMTFGPLVAGSYSVTQVPVSGWELTGIVCTDGGTGDVASGSAQITLTPGTHVTCTFTNGADLPADHADLGVAVETSTVAPGPAGSVRLVVDNNGAAASTDAVVVASIDAHLAVGVLPTGCGAAASVGATTLTCAAGAVAPHMTKTIVVPVKLKTPCTHTGTPGDDVLTGTNGKDVMCGFGGSDVVHARGGNDVVWGDTPPGMPTEVTVRAAVSASLPDPNPSNNATSVAVPVVTGADGNDTVYAGFGADTVSGGGGNDTVFGDTDRASNTGTGDSDSMLDGGAGDDKVYGQGGNDKVVGGPGNDVVSGGGGQDKVTGDDGDDAVDAGGGSDCAYGGAGNDTINAGDGNDIVSGGEGDDVIYGDVADANNVGSGDADGLLDGGPGNDNIYGQGGYDKIVGGAGNDIALGGKGNDAMFGDDGDDTFDGGKGNDAMHGDKGNDVLIGGRGNERVWGGDGNDIIHADNTNVADLTAGTEKEYLDGGPGNDRIYGQGGADIVSAGSGDDFVVGGAGPDKVHGDDGNDVLYGNGSADDVFGGGGDDWVFGDESDDDLDGGSGVDAVDGGAGNDVLYGGESRDWLMGKDGADKLFGESGDDILNGGPAPGRSTNKIDGGPGTDCRAIAPDKPIVSIEVTSPMSDCAMPMPLLPMA